MNLHGMASIYNNYAIGPSSCISIEKTGIRLYRTDSGKHK